MITRVITGCVLLPLLILLIWFPQFDWPFAVAIAVLAGIGLYEYYGMVRRRTRSAPIVPETVGGILAGACVVLIAQTHVFAATAFALYAACLFIATIHVLRTEYSLEGLATSCFGLLYIGWFAAHLVLLHGMPKVGPGLVTILIVAVALTDAAAYLTGSLIGRHKMAPHVSPNKTWEGAIGGFVATLIGMVAFYALSTTWMHSLLPEWSLSRYLLTGAVLSVVGQIGDLTESTMKRSAGVKDSGILFPGHGGVLDRGDGYLFAAPVLYYMVSFLFHG